MSPDKKLEWFKQRGWTEDEIAEVRKLVVDRFNNSYCPTSLRPPAASASLSLPAPLIGRARVRTIHFFCCMVVINFRYSHGHDILMTKSLWLSVLQTILRPTSMTQ
jgi:hypothetical protein